MTSSLSIEEFIDVDQFAAEITADISDLNEEFRTITARTAYYAIQAAKAKTQANRIENIVKATEAKLKVEHRKSLTKAAQDVAEEDGGKPEKITADMVNSAVYTDPRMLRLLDIQLKADEVRTVCNAAVDAFRTRREAAKSLGHLTTEQMRSQMRITGQQTAQSVSNSREEYRKRRASREAQNNSADT